MFARRLQAPTPSPTAAPTPVSLMRHLIGRCTWWIVQGEKWMHGESIVCIIGSIATCALRERQSCLWLSNLRQSITYSCVTMCVCVCVRERECVCVCVCMYVDIHAVLCVCPGKCTGLYIHRRNLHSYCGVTVTGHVLCLCEDGVPGLTPTCGCVRVCRCERVCV